MNLFVATYPFIYLSYNKTAFRKQAKLCQGNYFIITEAKYKKKKTKNITIKMNNKLSSHRTDEGNDYLFLLFYFYVIQHRKF